MSELNPDIPDPIPVESLESDTIFKKAFTDVEIFKIAKNLKNLNNNLTNAEIASATGLPLDVVQRL